MCVNKLVRVSLLVCKDVTACDTIDTGLITAAEGRR